MRKLAAQARAEIVMTLRNGESLLVTMMIPIGLFVFLVNVPLLEAPSAPAAHYLPRTLAAAVIGAAMVNLGIGTSFERHYKVLKRLGGTPLGRSSLLAAKAVAVITVMLIQSALLIAAGALLGWDHTVNVASLAAALVLGAACFAGLGMLLAGTISAHLNLAILNGLFVLMLLGGGVMVSPSALPGAMGQIASVLPSHLLTTTFDSALNGGAASGMQALAVWAAVTCAAAAALFRWE